MRSLSRILSLVSVIVFVSTLAYGATITGTVKGPDGAPFKGAFVQARNSKINNTTIVLSDKEGRYRIENLREGEYTLRIKAVGYKADPRGGVKLTANQDASFDWALEKGVVRWSDISISQAKRLWPEGRGKKEFEGTCLGCHGFQSKVAAVRRDEAGYRERIIFMRDIVMAPNRRKMTDQQVDDITHYVTSLFGTDVQSVLPPSPADLPKYKDVVQHFSDDAMNVVYVEYDMPGPSRFPFNANPAKDGSVWIPELSTANGVVRLDPKTGEMQEFKEPPTPLDNHTHSAVTGPDGTVWFTEQAPQRIGKLDPKTGVVTEIPDKVGTHTVRVGPTGEVWGSGGTWSYDPKTGKFTKYGFSSYALEPDPQGNVWFTSGNDLVVVDGETRKVTKYTAPTHDNNFNRRIAIDPDGTTVWFAEYNTGKLASFDSKTKNFKEYQLPGAEPTPYALGVDKDHGVWYSSEDNDYIGRLDSRTGKITLYPLMYPENGMREFNFDSQGRMWYGATVNNTVGYLCLAGARSNCAAK